MLKENTNLPWPLVNLDLLAANNPGRPLGNTTGAVTCWVHFYNHYQTGFSNQWKGGIEEKERKKGGCCLCSVVKTLTLIQVVRVVNIWVVSVVNICVIRVVNWLSGQSSQHMSGQSGQPSQTEDTAGIGLKKAPGLDLNTCALKIDHMLDIHSTSSKNPTLYTWCLPQYIRMECISFSQNCTTVAQQKVYSTVMWRNTIEAKNVDKFNNSATSPGMTDLPQQLYRAFTRTHNCLNRTTFQSLSMANSKK